MLGVGGAASPRWHQAGSATLVLRRLRAQHLSAASFNPAISACETLETWTWCW